MAPSGVGGLTSSTSTLLGNSPRPRLPGGPVGIRELGLNDNQPGLPDVLGPAGRRPVSDTHTLPSALTLVQFRQHSITSHHEAS